MTIDRAVDLLLARFGAGDEWRECFRRKVELFASDTGRIAKDQLEDIADYIRNL